MPRPLGRGYLHTYYMTQAMKMYEFGLMCFPLAHDILKHRQKVGQKADPAF